MKKRGMTPEQAKKIREEKGLKETKLQVLRTQKGLSQAELAAISGVAKRTVQGYEQDTRSIDNAKLDTLCSLCLALDCKMEDIIEDKELIIRYRKIK